jgi:hypothetical protein
VEGFTIMNKKNVLIIAIAGAAVLAIAIVVYFFWKKLAEK